MDLQTLGNAIRDRRESLGLTQSRLAQLSDISRQTLVGLEAGTLNDLGFNRVGQVMTILGLDFPPPGTGARERKRGLWMAAKTASVSYRHAIGPRQLGHALAIGEVPDAYMAHVAHLLDEAPLPLVVMAVEEAAALEDVPPRQVWRGVRRLAKDLQVHRQALWV